MSILVNSETRVVGQGITGKAGSKHALNNIAYGTRYVGAVTPEKAVSCSTTRFRCSTPCMRRFRKKEPTHL